MNISVESVLRLYNLPINALMRQASIKHHEYFPEGEIELATLLSIKTGGCPEDCSYCPQASRYDTGVKAEKLMELEDVLRAASAAKKAGSNRFCMGAAWREPKDRDIKKVAKMVKGVKELGLETCVTLGMLEKEQAQELSDAGLDFYNHNLDTSKDFYGEIITTREYEDRLRTLQHVRDSGISVCCGGIIGMGENREQRAKLLATIANLDPYPESVPINHLVPVKGTPLAKEKGVDPIEFVRTIAIARIIMPKARVRLSAGRQQLGKEVQAMCFMAGANSIFYGEKLLTTGNPEINNDIKLLKEFGLKTKRIEQMDAQVL